MNATINNAANNNATVEVLCRFDPTKNKPVVYVTTNMADGKIPAWYSGNTTEALPMTHYHASLPLSAADEDILAKRFARSMGVHVLVRHRLPRTVRVVENRLAKTPVAVQEAAPAAPAAGGNVVPLVAAKTPAKTPAAPAAKAAAPKKPVRKTGQRRSAAKPIESQPAPAPVVTVDAAKPAQRVERRQTPALEAKVDQLAQLVAQLTAKLGVEIVAK